MSYVDAQVGKVLAELEALDLDKNTIVILWGDHGWCIDDYARIGKHSVLERAVISPLIIRAPETHNPPALTGLQSAGVVGSIDIYPTIADLCGLSSQVPASAVGSSLVPMLRNPFAPGKNHVYSRWGGATSIRTNTHRLIQSGSGVNDLYDLTNHRYELEDISSSNSTLTTELANLLDTQSSRSGTTYLEWTNGNPSLANPDSDADADGASNILEYATGTDPLDSASKSDFSLSLENLGRGLEPVFSFRMALEPDDVFLYPSTSTDLSTWSPAVLELVDASPLSNEAATWVRFRLAQLDGEKARFFRAESGME
ncbi:sulfatase-like hydrolase/transferase [Akkermansiaceae bacterium]|nr:sulfatase-like hydrolase/transferase [Akkermansiaceae bacterium]